MKHHLRIVTKTIPADLQTPVGIYLKVRDLFPQSALLESSDYHTTQNSFSFIGVEPLARFAVVGNSICCRYPDGQEVSEEITPDKDVVEALKAYIASFQTEENPTGINGFFGYTAYDAVKYFEAVKIQPKYLSG